MSDWNGPAHRGAMRMHRKDKRDEAEQRDRELPQDSPRRRRNKGLVITAPPITLTAVSDASG